MKNPILCAHRLLNKGIITILLIAFIFSGLPRIPAEAQDIRLPVPGVRISVSPPFDPPVLKGIKVHADNPFRFDFILDKGDDPSVIASPERAKQSQTELKAEANKLIKYFLASITVPEKDLWVNLSPYEKDRIIPKSFGLTEMGRDLLAEDYMLKQITASLIYPEEEVGKKFWKRIYAEAAKKYGTTNIPVNTFNKVWIIPEKAVVYENAKAGTAYVVESKLKVMLEEDYLSLQKHSDVGAGSQPAQERAGYEPAPTVNNLHSLASQIVREVVIPELTREINEGKNFAQLRQVYNSLILATWYKKKIKDSILAKVYADKNKVAGVTINDVGAGSKPALERAPTRGAPTEILDTNAIYQRYLRAFKKGVYNYIKEEQDPMTQEVIPRKYFSGGMSLAMTSLTTGAMLSIVNNHTIKRWWPLISESILKKSFFTVFTAIQLTSAVAQTQPSSPSLTNQSSDQQRLEMILGADTIKKGINKKVLIMILDYAKESVDNKFKSDLNWLRERIGDEFLGRPKDAQRWLLLMDGNKDISQIYDKATEIFGQDLLRQEGGWGLLYIIKEKQENPYQFETMTNVVSVLRNQFGDKVDKLFLDKFTFDELLSSADGLYEGRSGRIRGQSILISFFEEVKKNLSQTMIDDLLSNPKEFVGFCNHLRPETYKDVVKSLRVLSEQYEIRDLKQLADSIFFDGEWGLFVGTHDIDTIRQSMANVLGNNLANQLLPHKDLKSIKELSKMPKEFINDPEAYLRKVPLGQELLRSIFTSWETARNFFQQPASYQTKLQGLMEAFNAKFKGTGMEGLLSTNASTYFRLLSIMDKNGTSVINDELTQTMTNVAALYQNTNTQHWLQAIQGLKPIEIKGEINPFNTSGQDNDHQEMIRRVNSQLREYYLDALYYMVSSRMINPQQFPEEKVKNLILSILVNTTPIDKGIDTWNATSGGEVGLGLIKDLHSQPEMILCVLAHEIGHNLFGNSEALADIWAFAFLQKIGYEDAIPKFQKKFGYDKIDPKSTEEHAVGRGRVKLFTRFVKEFSGEANVDWVAAGNVMAGLKENENITMFQLFSRYVKYKPLNVQQQEYFEKINAISASVGSLIIPDYDKWLNKWRESYSKGQSGSIENYTFKGSLLVPELTGQAQQLQKFLRSSGDHEMMVGILCGHLDDSMNDITEKFFGGMFDGDTKASQAMPANPAMTAHLKKGSNNRSFKALGLSSIISIAVCLFAVFLGGDDYIKTKSSISNLSPFNYALPATAQQQQVIDQGIENVSNYVKGLGKTPKGLKPVLVKQEFFEKDVDAVYLHKYPTNIFLSSSSDLTHLRKNAEHEGIHAQLQGYYSFPTNRMLREGMAELNRRIIDNGLNDSLDHDGDLTYSLEQYCVVYLSHNIGIKLGYQGFNWTTIGAGYHVLERLMWSGDTTEIDRILGKGKWEQIEKVSVPMIRTQKENSRLLDNYMETIWRILNTGERKTEETRNSSLNLNPAKPANRAMTGTENQKLQVGADGSGNLGEVRRLQEKMNTTLAPKPAETAVEICNRLIESLKRVGAGKIVFRNQLIEEGKQVEKIQEIPLEWTIEDYGGSVHVMVYPFTSQIDIKEYDQGLRDTQLEILKTIGKTKTNVVPEQGSLGRVTFTVKINNHGEPILIIKENQPSLGFRRIKTGGRQDRLRKQWINHIHQIIIHQALAEGIKKVYAIPGDLILREYNHISKKYPEFPITVKRYYNDIYDNSDRWIEDEIESKLTDLAIYIFNFGIPPPETVKVWRWNTERVVEQPENQALTGMVDMKMQAGPNRAMNGREKRGGIDLTSLAWNGQRPGQAKQFLQTQNSGGEIRFHVDQAMLQQLQESPGFEARVISIEPMNNLREFLGLKVEREEAII